METYPVHHHFYDLGIEYVGKCHTLHLHDFLKKHYAITEDCICTNFSGIDLDLDCSKRTCYVSMSGYIEKFLARYSHLQPSNPQLSPRQHSPISYGAKTQQPAEPYSHPPLDTDRVKRVQGILGALLWY